MTCRRRFIYPPVVSTSERISSKQISFGIAGIIFGFLLGYVTAYEIHTGRMMGVTQAAAAPPSAPMGGNAPPAGAAGGGPQADRMAQVQQELAALRQALDQDPNNLVALVRMGNMYMDASMFDKAADLYQRALDVDPNNPDVRTDMGACLREMGKTKEALAAFEKSLSQDPNHWKSWFNIAIVNLYDLGDYEKADAAFRKVVELNPGALDMKAVEAEIREGQGAERQRDRPEEPVVRRFLLIAALFAFAWVMLRRMFAPARPASGRSGRQQARRREGSTELVRDRVCNTFIPKTRALSLEEGGRTHFFCSEECRSRHQAGSGSSHTEELAS